MQTWTFSRNTDVWKDMTCRKIGWNVMIMTVVGVNYIRWIFIQWKKIMFLEWEYFSVHQHSFWLKFWMVSQNLVYICLLYERLSCCPNICRKNIIHDNSFLLNTYYGFTMRICFAKFPLFQSIFFCIKSLYFGPIYIREPCQCLF